MNKLSKKPEFVQKGLKGYRFEVKNKAIEVYLVNVTTGHDSYIISKKCTHFYYVLEGRGFFDIEKKKIKVKKGNFIEIEPKKEYTYSGKMKLLLMMNPPWFLGNETIIRKNPKVYEK